MPESRNSAPALPGRTPPWPPTGAVFWRSAGQTAARTLPVALVAAVLAHAIAPVYVIFACLGIVLMACAIFCGYSTMAGIVTGMLMTAPFAGFVAMLPMPVPPPGPVPVAVVIVSFASLALIFAFRSGCRAITAWQQANDPAAASEPQKEDNPRA